MFKNKKVLVVGLGKSGCAAANLLVQRGATVFLTESKPRSKVTLFLKKLSKKVITELGRQNFLKEPYDLVVVSPGVPWNHPQLEKYRRNNIPVWPEIELAFRCIHPKKIIAVTGTNGKTTTTALIGHILKSAGRPTQIGGNIGTPLCDLVSRIHSQTFVVVEVSSYQLEAIDQFHPNVGIVMNLTPDHLARHKTMAGYAKAKAQLYRHCTSADTAIYKKSDRWCRKIVQKTRAKKRGFPDKTLLSLAKHIRLLGAHNGENAMAASAAALALGLSRSEIIKGLSTFKAVPHRIEPIRTVKDVLYVNDSKATNIDSTLVALASFNQPLFLILGGEHKGSPYKPLIPLIKKKVKQVLTIGEAAPLVEKDLKNIVPIRSCGTLANAIELASQNAIKGDVVLLSPACASFDQFKNFEDRGEVFKNLVNAL